MLYVSSLHQRYFLFNNSAHHQAGQVPYSQHGCMGEAGRRIAEGRAGVRVPLLARLIMFWLMQVA